LKNTKIKYEFAIKSEKELDSMNQKELLKYIKNLQKNIVQEKPPKNSTNSSIAPSSDIGKKKKNQSLRKKSGKSSGGQKGHKAVNLEQTNTPDETIDIEYTLTNCKKCDYDLSESLAKLKEKRQVVDLELQKIKTKITQYQSYSKVCSNCGYDNHDNTYPLNVAPNISYGNSIIAIVNYLSVVQYIPYNRVVSLLKDIFKISISQGTVDNLLKKASKLSQKELTKIIEKLGLSSLIGIEEQGKTYALEHKANFVSTGCKVNKSKDWYWAFQNKDSTLVVYNESRGTKVITDTFQNGFVNATVVHDNYSGYSKLECKNEQLCIAHKLRDLNYAIECEDTPVMKQIKELLCESMLTHKLDLTSQSRIIFKKRYEERLDLLLTANSFGFPETTKQIKSFQKARDKIFTFMNDENIPPDNNGSERAIRNVKVKLKVSQQFKSDQGAIDYGNIRSIIDTSRKRGLNEFESLVSIIGGKSLF